MKTLYLIRHAKSSWEFNLDDHQRPLNTRGYQDAKAVGLALKARNLPIEKVIGSDAVRAKTTAKIVIDIMEIDPNTVTFDSKLYDFQGEHVFEEVKLCDTAIDHLMLFGHNHALTRLANQWGDLAIDNVPTAGVVAITFDIKHWSALQNGKTIFTVFPKALRL